MSSQNFDYYFLSNLFDCTGGNAFDSDKQTLQKEEEKNLGNLVGVENCAQEKALFVEIRNSSEDTNLQILRKL